MHSPSPRDTTPPRPSLLTGCLVDGILILNFLWWTWNEEQSLCWLLFIFKGLITLYN